MRLPIWSIQDASGNVLLTPQLRGGCHRWRPGWHGRKHSQLSHTWEEPRR